MSQQAAAEGQQQEGLQREAEIRRLSDENIAKLLAGDMTQGDYDASDKELGDKLDSIEQFYERADKLNTIESRKATLADNTRQPKPRRPLTSQEAPLDGALEGASEISYREALSEKLDAFIQLQHGTGGGRPRLAMGSRPRALLNAYLRPRLDQLPKARALKESLSTEDMEFLHRPRTELLMNAYVDREGGWVTADEMRTELIALRELEVGLVSRARQIQTNAMTVSFPTAAVVFDFAKRGRTGQDSITPQRLTDVFGKTRFQPAGRDVILKVPRELVEDPFFDLIPFLGQEANRVSREEDELLMILGSGAGEPLGYVNALIKLYDALIAASDTTNAGKIGIDPDGTLVPNFSGAAFNSEYIQVFDTFLIANARQNAVWTGPRIFERKVRLFRTNPGGDNTGEYLFKRALQAGAPNTLNGYPILISEFWEDNITSGSTGDPMFHFGDLNDYWWVTKQGLRLMVLDQLYAESREIGFQYDKAQDGSLVRADGNIYGRRQA